MGNSPHYVHVFSTFAPGGPQVRTAFLMGALGDGAKHTVIAMDGRTECAERVADSVDFRCVPLGLDPRSPWFAWGLIRRLKSLRPDLLLTYNWGAIESVFAARWGRIAPVIHHEEGFRPDEAQGEQKGRRVFARRLLLKGRVRRVVVPSLVLRDLAVSSWRLSPDRVLYIPNGVDGEKFRPGSAESVRSSWGIGKDALVVGAVAHLTPVKDVTYLLEAFEMSKLIENDGPPVFLVIAGDGPERGVLEERVKELGLGERVRFLGRVAETSSCYPAFDCLAVSSKTEQMPIVVLEAMSSGLPIVSTDVGDVRTMVSEENRAFVVDRDRREEYRARLVELVEDSSLRATIGKSNRRRCGTEYDLEGMVKAYSKLYREAMSSGQGG